MAARIGGGLSAPGQNGLGVSTLPHLSCWPRSRSSVAASAVRNAPGTSWFTKSDSFQSIMEPHRYRADLLESAIHGRPVMEVPASRDEAIVLMERLQHETAAEGIANGLNVVPFTGGNGPALLAYLLNTVFDGAVVACIGSADRLPQQQVQHAQYVADLLGIELVEVDDAFWRQVQLPEALGADAEALCNSLAGGGCEEVGMTVFCSATADDVTTFCMRGLCPSGVKAPLAGLSRAAVNALSQAIGLPTQSTSDFGATSLQEEQAVAA